MAVAAAEQTIQFSSEEINQHLTPLVLVVPEMAEDSLVRSRATRFIGSVALQFSEGRDRLEIIKGRRGASSLMEAIHGAAYGSEQDLKLVRANARTDVIERTIKAGHVTKIALALDNSGKVWQHGQAMDEVMANTLQFASEQWQMRERVEAETRNSFRIENTNRHGLLNNYYFVVWSRAADNMTKDELTNCGFFVDTMSVAIQATTARGEGLSTESAFVAGIKEPGDEQHDVQTVINVAAMLGVDYAGKSATEIIDTPLLIHKSLMPNGVIDLVKLYDDSAEGTFFGEAKPRQDYVAYLQKCAERELDFKPKVDSIVADLIAEASHINSPPMATRRLHKISEKYMVEHTVTDKTIDPQVFGPEAAAHIEMARWHLELGNDSVAKAETAQAIDTARSFSCPNGGTSSDTIHESNGGQSSSDDADCEFVSKKCPNCGAKNVKTTVSKIAKTQKKLIKGDCGCSKIADAAA